MMIAAALVPARRADLLLAALSRGFAPDARAQNALSGSAYGVFADVARFATTERDPSVVLPPDGGTTTAHLAVTGLATTPDTRRAESERCEHFVDREPEPLGALVTSDQLVSQTSCTGDGVTATGSSVGTTQRDDRLTEPRAVRLQAEGADHEG